MTTTNTARKTVCRITRSQFTSHATPVVATINDQPLSATPKQFSTGSVGWFANGKVRVKVDGVLVDCQVSMNITVIGSKELPGAGVQPTVEVSVEDTLAAIAANPRIQALRAAQKAKEELMAAAAV